MRSKFADEGMKAEHSTLRFWRPLTLLPVLLLAAVLGMFAAGDGATVLADPGPDLTPDLVDETIPPGGSVEIEKTVHTPEIPPQIDVCLLEDETGSFANDIANLQGGTTATDIYNTVTTASPGAQFAVAGFRDYPQAPHGGGGDHVYRLLSAMNPNLANWLAGVGALGAGGGADGPEAQYDAIVAAAGPGQFNDPTVGLQDDCGWRVAAVTRVLVVATDAPFHLPGGGKPHVNTQATTVTALDNQGIAVVGLKAPGAGNELNNLVGALAAGGSVQALSSDGANIGAAIVAGLQAIQVNVAMVSDCVAPISVSFDPASQTVVSGEDAVFTETVSVAAGAPPGIYECDDFATIDGQPMTDPATGEIIKEHKIIRVPAVFLIIDEETIDDGISTIRAIAEGAPFCGGPAGGPAHPNGHAICVNDDLASYTAGRDGACDPNNPMVLFSRPTPRAISGLLLPTGQFDGTSGDEGLFSPLDPAITGFDLDAYLDGCIPQSALDPASAGFALRSAQIEALKGRTVCAVVHDSDVSILNGTDLKLQGSRQGLTAFHVVDVLPPPAGVFPEAGSSSSLPVLEVDVINDDTDDNGINDVLDVCEGPLEFLPAPLLPRDSDADGFPDGVEVSVGTNPVRACGANAWPPDPAPESDGNGIVQIDDVSFAAGAFGSTSTPRAEIASQDGVVQIDDLSAFASRFGHSCTLP